MKALRICQGAKLYSIRMLPLHRSCVSNRHSNHVHKNFQEQVSQMLLKTKLILVFTCALFIFGITQAYFKFQDLQATIQSEVQSRDAANSVIWLKIVSQVSNNMEFYAQGSESGGSPIWTLRGKRSPVDSIKSGNVKRLEITLTPFYEDLTARGVIDSMAV